jgi:hypothetical protein
MSEIHSIYCDESCHLENDRQAVMVLGALWCPAVRAAEISVRLREIKLRHGVLSLEDLRGTRTRQCEVKWTKVSLRVCLTPIPCVPPPALVQGRIRG